MAWNRVNHLSEFHHVATDPFSVATSAFTPQSNSILVVALGIVNQAAQFGSHTVSGGGLTWTRLLSVSGDAIGGYISGSEVWIAPVGAAASMTLNVSSAQNTGDDAIQIRAFSYTGYDTSTPSGTSGSKRGMADGADGFSLAAAPASDSMVVAARFYIPIGGDDPSANPGTGWTEIYDGQATNAISAGYGMLQIQERTGSTLASVAWADTIVGSTDAGWTNTGLAIELKAAVTGGPTGAAGSATGTGAAIAGGASTVARAAAASGVANATAAGASVAAAIASASGNGTAAAAGADAGGSVGLAGATGAALGVGGALTSAVGTASGSSGATAIGEAVGGASGYSDFGWIEDHWSAHWRRLAQPPKERRPPLEVGEERDAKFPPLNADQNQVHEEDDLDVLLLAI